MDHQEQQRRSEYLDALYDLDGRADMAHPHHHSYTALFKTRLEQLVAADMAALVGGNDA